MHKHAVRRLVQSELYSKIWSKLSWTSWTWSILDLVDLALDNYDLGWYCLGQLWPWMKVSWTIMTLDESVVTDYDPGRSWLGRKWHYWARMDEMPLDEMSGSRAGIPHSCAWNKTGSSIMPKLGLVMCGHIIMPRILKSHEIGTRAMDPAVLSGYTDNQYLV